MKRDSLSKFCVFVYVNLWYVPLLAFLLGVKISLISMLADSMGRGGGSRGATHSQDQALTNQIIQIVNKPNNNNANEGNHNHHRKIRNNPQVNTISNNNVGWEYKLKMSHQPLSAQDWELLAHIEGATISATALNRTDKGSIWLILNQVPWGGGDVMDNLLLELQDQNNFKHLQHEYRTPWPRFLLEEEQKSLVTWFEYQHLPRSYDRHFYFVNFTKYQQYVFENPIYVNMVQDPVSRLRLAFDWKRSDKDKVQQEVERRNGLEVGSGQRWLEKEFQDCILKADPECGYEEGSQDFTLMVPFFCGQFNACVTINNKWALQTAKFNIEKYYSVVGLFERIPETLLVLENYIPRFFAGATNFEPEKIRPDPPPVAPEVRRLLQQKLASEFDLYEFIAQRLEKQLRSLRASGRTLQVTANSNDLK